MSLYSRQHGIETVLVVADELGPAANPIVEVIIKDDAFERVEAVEARIGAIGKIHTIFPLLTMAVFI